MENSGKLHGKVAVITGASKGIGAGIAKAYANCYGRSFALYRKYKS
jgi:NAD(P)-dependent dehydrogenase (short-subunit alcohol dehydrogenase family)